MLIQQTINITLHSPNGTPPSFSDLGGAGMIIEASIQISEGNPNVFNLTGSVEIDTTGKILVQGSVTFGDTYSVNAALFVDLSHAPNSVTAYFLMQEPAQTTLNPLPPILTIDGSFSFSSSSSGVVITITGQVITTLDNQLTATLNGMVTLTVNTLPNTTTVSSINLAFQASLSVTYLGDLGSVTGNFTIQNNSSGSVDVWGVLLVTPNLSALQQVGIDASGSAYFEINTSSQTQSVTVSNATQPLQLQPGSFSILINGGATFEVDGQEVSLRPAGHWQSISIKTT